MKSYIHRIPTIFVLSLILGCGDSKTTNPQEDSDTTVNDNRIHLTKAQFSQSDMQLGSPIEKSFPISVTITGVIDVPPQNRAVVNATMGGYIKTTPLLIGDMVKKGQALVTIENPEFVTLQQNYMETHQQMDYLRSEYERQKILQIENITSEKSFLKSESEYKTAQARLNGLRKQLMMLNISPSNVENGNIISIATIFAPISGSITKINVSKGTYVSPASPILEIIDNDHIHIELTVFEKDIMKIKKGQTIHFKIPETSDKTYEAEVHLIGTSIDENRTIKVHGHLKDEDDHNFITGMFVEAGIVIDAKPSKALPETSFVNLGNKTYVLKLKEENQEGYFFEQEEVKIGNTVEGYTSLLDAGDMGAKDVFLTKGTFDLIAE